MLSVLLPQKSAYGLEASLVRFSQILEQIPEDFNRLLESLTKYPDDPQKGRHLRAISVDMVWCLSRLKEQKADADEGIERQFKAMHMSFDPEDAARAIRHHMTALLSD